MKQTEDPRGVGTQLDPAPFRRRAEALFSAAGPGRRRRRWDDCGAGIDEAALEELIGEAEPFLAAGQGGDGLAILKPVTGALADYWPECAHWDETLHEFFPRLDGMIAQAVLMDGVSQEAREDLADELGGWQDELAEYGADDAFSTAIAACMRGWDEPGLEDALAGRGKDWSPGAGGLVENDLIEVRFAALEAMGRTEHFLNLSRAAGRYCDHAVMLVLTGHVDDPQRLMEGCFDLHLYFANWGTRRLMIRVPERLVNWHGLGVLLDEVEPDYDQWDDFAGWLAALAPLRADILSGDYGCFVFSGYWPLRMVC